ncbi:MAG TPA: alpha/beta fold hydrolase [Nitrospira sp.]|nr:alpha/beta fold hydrolase [Nitrospira sp.]
MASKNIGRLDDMIGRQQTDLSLSKDSNALVYLVHGVTGTPVEMSYLAGKLLRKNRWDVYATTLPGHCTRIKDLVRTTEEDWRHHVQAQLNFARDRYEYVFAVGLSAGALLALDASKFVRLDGVGVLSPTFVYDGWNTPWSHAILPLAMRFVPLPLQRFVFHIDGPPFGIKDKRLQASVRQSYSPMVIVRDSVTDWWGRKRAKAGTPVPPFPSASKGYPIFPLRTLTEIDRLIVRVQAGLHEVTAPAIILQAREDDMTSPRNATLVYHGISSKEKELVLLDDCYHVITVDNKREAVLESLSAFFQLQKRSREASAQRQVSP